MKILHTADWHLGKRIGTFSRHKEQVAVLEEICDIAERENVDAVVIAGDCFDTFNPPAESEELFYRICKRLSNNGLRAVIAIAGNHDAPERFEAPSPLAYENGIIFVGYPHTKVRTFALPTGLSVTRSTAGFFEMTLPHCPDTLRVFTTPYTNEVRLRRALNKDMPDTHLNDILSSIWLENLTFANAKTLTTPTVNILISHLFFTEKNTPPQSEPDEERPINVGGSATILTENIPEGFDYVALGHLHRQHKVGGASCPVVYAGSPLSYSFQDESPQKYVVIIEKNNTQDIEIKRIKLEKGKKLIKITTPSVSDAFEQLRANINELVTLEIVTDTFLKSEDIRQMRQIHTGIVAIFPKIINAENTEISERKHHTHTSMQDLFVDFFNYRKKMQPNEKLLHLFEEILTENHEFTNNHSETEA